MFLSLLCLFQVLFLSRLVQFFLTWKPNMTTVKPDTVNQAHPLFAHSACANHGIKNTKGSGACSNETKVACGGYGLVAVRFSNPVMFLRATYLAECASSVHERRSAWLIKILPIINSIAVMIAKMPMSQCTRKTAIRIFLNPLGSPPEASKIDALLLRWRMRNLPLLFMAQTSPSGEPSQALMLPSFKTTGMLTFNRLLTFSLLVRLSKALLYS